MSQTARTARAEWCSGQFIVAGNERPGFYTLKTFSAPKECVLRRSRTYLSLTYFRKYCKVRKPYLWRYIYLLFWCGNKICCNSSLEDQSSTSSFHHCHITYQIVACRFRSLYIVKYISAAHNCHLSIYLLVPKLSIQNAIASI